MSTLAEIEAAIEQLPVTQQEELYAFLGGRVDRPAQAPSPEAFSRWLETARGAAMPGIITGEIMLMTRGRE